jgi:hypothetical protein
VHQLPRGDDIRRWGVILHRHCVRSRKLPLWFHLPPLQCGVFVPCRVDLLQPLPLWPLVFQWRLLLLKLWGGDLLWQR